MEGEWTHRLTVGRFSQCLPFMHEVKDCPEDAGPTFGRARARMQTFLFIVLFMTFPFKDALELLGKWPNFSQGKEIA